MATYLDCSYSLKHSSRTDTDTTTPALTTNDSGLTAVDSSQNSSAIADEVIIDPLQPQAPAATAPQSITARTEPVEAVEDNGPAENE